MESPSDKYSGAERRRYPRLHASVVEYYPIGRAEATEMSFTENIGAGGICIFVTENLDIDTLLFLKIYLPHKETPIEAKGKVVWTAKSSFLGIERTKNFDVGVTFVEIGEDDRKDIAEYVRKYSYQEE